MSQWMIRLSLSFVLLMPCVANAEVAGILQTGQTTCTDMVGRNIGCSGSGQDGELRAGKQWGAGRFRANADGSYTDSATGLSWSSDADMIRSRNRQFDTDEAGDGKVTWQHALDYIGSLNTENFLGHNDWRLPNVNELASILTAEGSPASWLKTEGFVNVEESGYWTSTTYAENTLLAWSVDFRDGRVYYANKAGGGTALQYVWPVRGTSSILPVTGQAVSYALGDDGALRKGVKPASPRFSDLGDSTVQDLLTGLIWTKDGNAPAPTSCGPRRTKGLEEALSFVKCLNNSRYLGHDDWRLPNRNEISSLLNYDSKSFQSTLLKSGFLYVMKGKYWTSTSPMYGAFGWFLDMSSGFLDYRLKTARYFVWPVRAGWGSEPGKYNVAANISGNGAITVTIGMTTTVCTAGTGTCSYPVAQSEAAVLTAVPAEGFAFAGWSGTCTALSGPCRITMDGPAQVTATFKPVTP